MIRLTRCHRPDHVKEYFALHLATGDNPSNPSMPSDSLQSSWVGPALADVGLTVYSQPEAKHLVRLGRGLHPSRNVRLAPALNRKRAYYDVTISPPKTVSLAALLRPTHFTAKRVASAHKTAVEAVVREVGTMLLGQRHGTPAIKKWMAALFHHSHTREGEPHLHSHAVLPNVGQNEEGKWRAIQVDIAGQNRTRLELVYGNELARQLRKIGFGPHLVTRPNGLPEIRPFLPLVARFSTAKKNILAAAAADDRKHPSKRKESRWAGEPHPRSGVPVPDSALAMMRRRTLAERIRRVKPKDADNPVRLKDEADRWNRALSNREYLALTHFLDDLNPINPRWVRVLEPLPLPAAQIVKAAYARIHIDARLTPALLVRAAVAESAGQHPYGVLVRACVDSLERKRAAVRGIRDKMAARQYAAARNALWNQGAAIESATEEIPTEATEATEADMPASDVTSGEAPDTQAEPSETTTPEPTTVPAPSRGRGRRR